MKKEKVSKAAPFRFYIMVQPNPHSGAKNTTFLSLFPHLEGQKSKQKMNF